MAGKCCHLPQGNTLATTVSAVTRDVMPEPVVTAVGRHPAATIESVGRGDLMDYYRALGKVICPLCEQVAYLHTPRMCERCYQYMARRGVAQPEVVQAAEDALNAYWRDRYLWPHVLALLLVTRVWPPRHLVTNRELRYVA